ncbi:sialidase family protein [Streptomyces sp. NPDC097619]|uniref:sialidase family protein n=1 Tax=Streptomyces sp. NPDC097619 TaxID=3157228 RepID=UPI003329EF42
MYVNARSSEPDRCGNTRHRLHTTSTDGGATFAAPFTHVDGLDTSHTYGSLLRLTAKDRGDADNRLLYSGPARLGPNPLEDRRELAIRSSVDEGRTWQTVGTVVSAGRTGYSDLALVTKDRIGVLYETADKIPHGNLAFKSFTTGAMDAARTELRRPRILDESPAKGNDALVEGGAVIGSRGSGKAIELDGQDDYLRVVSCAENLRVKNDDFTVTAWFRHTDVTGPRPVIWAYGMPDPTKPNVRVPQFSVVAEPGATGSKGLLKGRIETTDGIAEVTADSAYADGKWHHVAFQRTAGKLVLLVDGGPQLPGGAEFTAPHALVGHASPTGQFTIHIGARPDFPNQSAGVNQLFRGGLDDVRLFGKALTEAQVRDIKAGTLDVAGDLQHLRLGFTEFK